MTFCLDDGACRGFRFDDSIARGLEQRAQDAADVGLIFDDEYLMEGLRHAPPPSAAT